MRTTISVDVAMDPMTNYVVPSPYDTQVPSTSSCTLARPNTPQTPYTPNSRSIIDFNIHIKCFEISNFIINFISL
uniref:Uncharacterized protein n=1 Tax=Heterorhabditis bacteriophora TaxID=37862 RepID=A0A1I7WTJ4_HETBA